MKSQEESFRFDAEIHIPSELPLAPNFSLPITASRQSGDENLTITLVETRISLTRFRVSYSAKLKPLPNDLVPNFDPLMELQKTGSMAIITSGPPVSEFTPGYQLWQLLDQSIEKLSFASRNPRFYEVFRKTPIVEAVKQVWCEARGIRLELPTQDVRYPFFVEGQWESPIPLDERSIRESLATPLQRHEEIGLSAIRRAQ